jgi:hypothetical protein
MEMPRLPKSVRRIVKLQSDERGALIPTVLYKERSRKRKVSSGLRPLERSIRKLARSQVRMADSYLSRHNRSNRKRKDGWLKDLASNVTNAGSKGRKTLSKDMMRWPKVIKLA